LLGSAGDGWYIFSPSQVNYELADAARFSHWILLPTFRWIGSGERGLPANTRLTKSSPPPNLGIKRSNVARTRLRSVAPARLK
jgi:hypothetical protein